jgi:hypothetical protein
MHTTAVLAVVCLLWAAAGADKPRPLTLVIDGETVTEPPTPRAIEGVTYVPLRLVSERLGISVEWQAKQRRAVLCRGDWCMVVAAGTGPDQGRLLDGRMFLPLRRVATSFGAKTEYDAKTGRVIITSPPKKAGWLEH